MIILRLFFIIICSTEMIIHEHSTIGFFNIKTYSSDTTFLPCKVNDVQFQSMKNSFCKNHNNLIRFDLSNKICNMLQSVSPMFRSDQNLENMGQNSLQSKQIYITRLVEQAGINVNMLKLIKNGAVKLDFYKMQSNLNQILLGQYVMKNGLNLNKDDLKQIQNSDPTLLKIITKMETDNSVCIRKWYPV